MATETNPNDPKGWVSNPPSTIVKVMGTTREDVNGKTGIVVQYNTERSRYMVHLTQSQNVVAMKPDNLVPASMMEKGQAYYEQACNEPQLRSIVNNVKARLPPGVTLQQVGIGLVVALLGLIYFLGFSRTLMLISFTMIFLMVIGPDLLDGNANLQTVMRNAPDRFKTMVRNSFPGGSFIADKPYLLAALAALMVAFFVMSMIRSPGASRTAASTGIPPMTDAVPSRRGLSTKMIEEYYKMGFDDAKADLEFGTSLPSVEETAPPDAPEEGDYELPEYPMPPPTAPSLTSKIFSMSSIMSIMYIGRTAIELGRGPDGQWSFPLLKANLSNMEPWKLGLLGLSVYRLVSAFLR